jgi:hypothetical protein
MFERLLHSAAVASRDEHLDFSAKQLGPVE